MSPSRRRACLAPLALAALGLAPSLRAQPQASDYPTKTVRLLVPFPAGGAVDVVARMIAADMATTLGRPVVVENRAGASGNIAMDAAARSAPDGHTIVLASASLAINPSLIKATSFDPRKDFTPISLVAMVPSALLVSASLPVKSIDELVAYAKSHPEPLAYGSNGVGTTQHLAAVLFGLRTGIRLNHVPYKGVDGLMPDLVANRIQLSFNNVASSLPHLKSGALRALAMGLPKRWPGLPDVPTFAEVGLADFDVSSWVGLFGPAGLPAPVVARLERAAVEALARPDMRQKIVTGGNDPVGGTAPELAQFLESEIEHWRRAIEAAGARPE